MAKKRLKIKDKQGNVVDYDISSASVTIDIEGKSLDVKLSEIATALLQAVTEVTFNGTPYNRENGKINLGQQMQADWNENNTNWPAYIRNKPNSVVNEMLYDQQSRKVRQRRNGVVEDVFTLPEEGSQVTFDEQMSSTSENGVQNKVIKAYVDAVSQRIDTLLGSGNVQGAIDTFNEVVAFLNGIDTSDPTLANQLLALNNAIANAGKVQSVSINGTNHTPNSSGVVDLGTIQGQKGDKGDTGNVQVDGNGNVLIVNNLEDGGTGAALSAEMGRRMAMMSGTFAQAWARSKAITSPFCWLWVETVNGAAISKPIWHKGNSVFVDATGAIINVPAASVPDAPTITGASNGSTVPKNTQITITPASGSALYYSIDGGNTYQTSDSAVTLTLATAGSVSIIAYCANNAGNSSSASLSVTVAGTAVPTFSQASGEVSRGGSVTISVPAGGELHYKVNSGAWQTASGTSVSIQITGATTIQAYNVQDGDTSSTITNNYTMAALASPTFSVATGTEFPIGGGSVGLTGPVGASIYYTTDGSTPTTASTLYSGAIAVASAMTIKAIAHDTYGDSAVAEASYTVVQPKIVVTATDATTMSLGETGLTALTINSGTTEFTPSDLGITSFADHVFPSLSFGDRTKISTFDGGGLQVNSLDDAFSTLTGGGSNPTLTKCVGIVLAGQDAHASQTFLGCTYLTECELNGVVNGSMKNAFFTSTGRLTSIDISGLSGHITDCGSMFMGVGCEVIDVSQFTFTKDKAASMFRNCSRLTTIKVGKLEMETANLINLMFIATRGVTTIICTETTPYTTGWLDTLNGQHALSAIYVPDASVNDYKAHSEWGTYASIIKGISEYTE